MSATNCHIQSGDKDEVFGKMRMNLQNIGLANTLLEFFCNLLRKNPDEFFCQVNIIILLLGTDSQLYSLAHSTPAWEMVVVAPNSWPFTSSLLPAWAWLCAQECTAIGLKCSDVILLAGPWDMLRHVARCGCVPLWIYYHWHNVCACSCLTLLWPHGLWPSRLLHLRNFTGKNIRVGFHFLLQGIFPTQGSLTGGFFTLESPGTIKGLII